MMGGMHGGYAIECDECGARLTGLGWNGRPTGPTPNEARAEAADKGWTFSPTKDFCPRCSGMPVWW